ncbi:putative fatty acyl-CoA reductase CG5065 isoform X3 [Ceratina calcarata]|uniref:Fatty acyl-CoA reductase n=1 Tax=Ceratina calcarata TaxID=156304 RepID=A0AAJ7SB83_9HYME|nr:putative fatty acyl-CoA reductase CG5065 isoform X3 [Ceratina calcarata]
MLDQAGSAIATGRQGNEAMSELTEIQSFYKGKCIFITGGTGLMGKVLIEKLLYSCSDLDKIYVLARPKRGRDPHARVDEMFKLPMFQRVRKQKPQVMKKVIPLNGDISTKNLGLTEEQLETLLNEVHVMFHFAATLRLESKLKSAIEMNTIGTRTVLEIAKRMKRLQTFVHLSTAFCYPDKEELDERVYDPPADPDDVMRLVEWMDETSLDLITPKLLDLHPNTYTYSKRLAEKLVADEYPNLPCTIARPSIVTPSWVEPLPGWVDNLNGPMGVLVGGGKGVIRSMHGNANYHAEVIPLDLAINALIAIAQKTATGENMVRLQRRITVGLELLQFFTTREWIFHNTNVMIMWDEMSPKDKELFPVDFLVVDLTEYIKNSILGARQYCMKEDLSTLPKARRHQAVMYVVHIVSIYLFYFGILYSIYNNFEVARSSVHSIAERMKALPILGKVV